MWLSPYVLILTHWVSRLGWGAFRVVALLLSTTFPLALVALGPVDVDIAFGYPVLSLSLLCALGVRGYAPAPAWAASLTLASLAGTLRRWRPR